MHKCMYKYDVKDFYGLLMAFCGVDVVCRGRLLRICPADMIDEAVERGYIYECGYCEGSDGRDEDIQYRITPEGKKARDGYRGR